MKKVLLFFILMSYFSASKAQDQPSSLQVRMWDNSLFSAAFAGDDTGKYLRTYNVRSVASGEYYLRIMQRTHDGIETLFEGRIEIPAGSRVQAILQQDGSLEVSVLEDTPRTSSSFDMKSKIDGLQTKMDNLKKNTKEGEQREMIASLEFVDLRNNMQRAQSDALRDSLALKKLNENLFTTAYVVQIAKLYKNEDSRLKFAKEAYLRVVDPEQYFQVRDLFYKEENKTALDKYMNDNVEMIQQRKFEGLF